MDINYLNEERMKLWEKIAEIETLLKEKSSDLEGDIKVHADNAAKYLADIGNNVSLMKTKAAEFDTLIESLQTILKSANNFSDTINADKNEISKLKDQIKKFGNDIESWHKTAQSQFKEIQDIYGNNATMIARLNEFESQCNTAGELSTKIDALHKNIIARKVKIDNIYYEIFGSIEKNESTGEETKVKGLKDELAETYLQLKTDFTEHQSTVNGSFDELSKRMSSFENLKIEEFDELIKNWKLDFDNVKSRIETLLPNALTTGLSYAYSDKKRKEVAERKSYAKLFAFSIAGMVIVSLIPFAVSIHSLYTEVPLNETILRLPRLVLAILPLYIPVLWIAYSSNKKGNLSKRLIEEYSHKEALSRTYEGLSTQINSLGNDDTAKELNVRLLYNILEISSENPGKLITDYNKSDHPVMDALDRSVKLSNSVEKLAKIPGFTVLARKLADKAESILESEKIKAEKGLESLD